VSFVVPSIVVADLVFVNLPLVLVELAGAYAVQSDNFNRR
jgi:hypothetical protein